MRARITLLAITLGMSLLTASSAKAQMAFPGNDPFPAFNEAESSYSLKTFAAKLQDNKVYVNWTATDTKGECIYIIERSADGVNYQKVYARKGAPSPGTEALLFSYTDNQPLKGTSYYRVQMMSNGSAQTITAQVTNGSTSGKSGDSVACNK